MVDRLLDGDLHLQMLTRANTTLRKALTLIVPPLLLLDKPLCLTGIGTPLIGIGTTVTLEHTTSMTGIRVMLHSEIETGCETILLFLQVLHMMWTREIEGAMNMTITHITRENEKVDHRPGNGFRATEWPRTNDLVIILRTIVGIQNDPEIGTVSFYFRSSEVLKPD